MKKKIIRPEGPAKKIILLWFCPKKYLGPDQKPKPPPPPPEYQMDRALYIEYDYKLIVHICIRLILYRTEVIFTVYKSINCYKI